MCVCVCVCVCVSVYVCMYVRVCICKCNSRCRIPPFPISFLKPKEMEILIDQYIEIPNIRNFKKKMWQQDFFDAGGDENLLIFFVSPNYVS